MNWHLVSISWSDGASRGSLVHQWRFWFEIVRRREQLAFSLACPPGSAVRAARYSGVNPVALLICNVRIPETQRCACNIFILTGGRWCKVSHHGKFYASVCWKLSPHAICIAAGSCKNNSAWVHAGKENESETTFRSGRTRSLWSCAAFLVLTCLFSLLFCFSFLFWPCFPSLTHKGVHFFDISLSWEFAHLHLISSDFLPFWPSPSFIFSELWLLNFFRL